MICASNFKFINLGKHYESIYISDFLISKAKIDNTEPNRKVMAVFTCAS